MQLQREFYDNSMLKTGKEGYLSGGTDKGKGFVFWDKTNPFGNVN